MNGADGKPAPLWRIFWGLFGTSNQLLAALTLLGVTVWLWRTRREIWVLFVVGLPTVFMYCMSTWALGRMIFNYVAQLQTSKSPNQITFILLGISSLLMILAVAMLIEAVIALSRKNDRTLPNAPATALVTG